MGNWKNFDIEMLHWENVWPIFALFHIFQPESHETAPKTKKLCYKYVLEFTILDDLAVWLERLTKCRSRNSPLGSIPTSFDTVESEGRQMKQCWIQHIEKKQKKSKKFNIASIAGLYANFAQKRQNSLHSIFSSDFKETSRNFFWYSQKLWNSSALIQ